MASLDRRIEDLERLAGARLIRPNIMDSTLTGAALDAALAAERKLRNEPGWYPAAFIPPKDPA